MSDGVSRLFDRGAPRYDATRRQLVPCFDDFYGAVLDLLPVVKNLPLRVLDLGAGTGLLAALIAASYPQAHITLIDLAPEMLRRAAERFEEIPERVTLCVADMVKTPLGGPYDAIVSALALHHLDDGQKRGVFARVARSLAAGGVFVNAEQVLGPTPAVERAYHAHWLRAVRARGVSEADLDTALERMQADRCASLSDQLKWLAAAGLVDVACWYQWGRFAVYTGHMAPIQNS